MEFIDKHIINRSTSAIKCLFFTSAFYDDAKEHGISAEHVLKMKNRYISKKYLKIKTAEKIETSFLWLIKIGILRREVDGQGLTSKVRVTPLARIILEDEPNLPNQKASSIELIKNWTLRKLLLK